MTFDPAANAKAVLEKFAEPYNLRAALKRTRVALRYVLMAHAMGNERLEVVSRPGERDKWLSAREQAIGRAEAHAREVMEDPRGR